MLLTVPLPSWVSMVGITAQVMQSSTPAPCIVLMEWSSLPTLHQPTLANTGREVSYLLKFHNVNMVRIQNLSLIIVVVSLTLITGSNMQVVKGHSSSSHTSYSLVDPASQDWHSILLGNSQLITMF